MTEGRLLLGATPLGQPSDASPRLIAALSTADVVAAEDTRRVRTLAKALDVRIGGNIVSFFDHVEASRVPELVDAISAGATVLVVSDAGMPLINDPGHRLVAACVEAGLAGAVPARPVGGDDRAGGVGAGVGEVLLRGIRARASRRRARVGWRRWRPSGARRCSSSRRAGWLPACATPSISSAGIAGPRCAAS